MPEHYFTLSCNVLLGFLVSLQIRKQICSIRCVFPDRSHELCIYLVQVHWSDNMYLLLFLYFLFICNFKHYYVVILIFYYSASSIICKSSMIWLFSIHQWSWHWCSHILFLHFLWSDGHGYNHLFQDRKKTLNWETVFRYVIPKNQGILLYWCKNIWIQYCHKVFLFTDLQHFPQWIPPHTYK